MILIFAQLIKYLKNNFDTHAHTATHTTIQGTGLFRFPAALGI